ncbi:hypothetical protein COA18_04545 [Priestia megaterium]|nr:hypothetical protein COA18_04545 [Priestia megaterium]
MNIQSRARNLKRMLDKQASLPKLPSLPTSTTTNSSLFPKLKGDNKPPVLTTSSQPTIDLTSTNLPTLPKMRVNGSKPKFSSQMLSADPYNKK